MNNPLVTVNILSFNREDELRHTLTKVFEQDYKNIEVIVVDNASTDGSAEMVEKEFPQVKLVRLKKNIGIAGWNKGFEIAEGDYVLVLDDDSSPDKFAIERAVKIFSKKPTLGIIAAKVYNTRTNHYETSGFRKTPDFFVGCGAFIKKKVFSEIGGFNNQIFIYLHELDYSARTYAAGFKIIYDEEIIIYHNQSKIRKYGKNKDPYYSSFRYYHYSISYSIFLLTHFNTKYVVKYLLKWILNRFIVALSYSFIFDFVKFLFFLLLKSKEFLKYRNPLPLEIQKFYRYGNVAFIDRDYFKKK